jgi:phosphoribosylglycinamide formyltransferase-1
MSKIRLALFASGTGSNVLNIISYFSSNSLVEVAFVLSNNSSAPVVEKVRDKGVKLVVATNMEVSSSMFLVNLCESHSVQFVILAGYLRLIPTDFVRFFKGRIINIHPSLLPKFGGKGMYGDFVHLAVLNEKETETGISIHFVDEQFDTGQVIAQFKCLIEPSETIATLKEKIRQLEYDYFPSVIEKTVLNF